MTVDIDDLVEELATRASAWSGFKREAIHRDAIRRAARDCLGGRMTPRELLRRATAADPEVVRVFRQAICVGETYFFRSPEHFAFLRDRVLKPAIAAGTPSLRAWSAACSTGEEAYSIAACLVDAAGNRGVALEVLGTDLSPESVRRAQLAEYGPWSVRETAPIPVPFLVPSKDGRVRIADGVRSIAKFATHDLLHPAPPEFGDFDVIFCRNVLVYFDPASIAVAVGYLAERLLPGGVIVFGVLEVTETPPGLVPVGGSAMAAFQRPVQGRAKAPTQRPRAQAPARARIIKRTSVKPEARRSVVPKRRSTAPPAAKPLPSQIRGQHLDALRLIETNRFRDALAILTRIQQCAPAYVAALLDQALLCQKTGRQKLAADLMHEILRLTEALPVETVLPGIEELPVMYYRTTAETFLKSMKRER